MTWQMIRSLGWGGTGGDIARWTLPVVASVVVVIVHHLGYWEYHNTAGSAARIERLAVLGRPADLDSGKITDKGYVNQRQVLNNRSALIELLDADPPPAHVIIPEGMR